MNLYEMAIFCFEIAGTVAFASSGAVLAIKKRMDLFGVCTLGIVTAVGGGLCRDLVLGNIPPTMFVKPVYTLVAVITSIIIFCFVAIFKSRMSSQLLYLYEKIMQFFDTIGLGIFSVTGVNTAFQMGYKNTFLLIFVGMLTGVGGGLVRDLLAQQKPYILTKDVYAVASILGACVCSFLLTKNTLFAMVLGASVVCESAVRITHIPSGIVVACQTERSQIQNRATAMKMLKSRLMEIKEREHLDKIEDIKGAQMKIEWGSQIRSYVFMPYTLVKDHRTGFENGNIGAVMDGDLEGFINAYLKCSATGEWAK